MAVSKRLRFEILRRDNHQCRYCRSTENPLTIDHVVPSTLGGSDDPGNLVAACKDCNAGKSASSPDAPLVADVAQDALRWSAAMRKAQECVDADQDKRLGRHEQFRTAWDRWTFASGETVELPGSWRQTVDQLFAADLPLSAVEEAIEIAMTRRGLSDEATFRYFCGVCWRKVSRLQEAAREILLTGDV